MNPQKQLEIPKTVKQSETPKSLKNPSAKNTPLLSSRCLLMGGEILEGRNIEFVEYESWKTTFNLHWDLNKHEALTCFSRTRILLMDDF